MKIKSLRGRILLSFCVLTLIPTITISFISLNNTTKILEKNFNTMTHSTLAQVNENVNLSLQSYKDLLYQIYVNESVVEWVDKLNKGEDTELVRSQLIRNVQEVANLKDYIESIMIIPKEGTPVFFDKLTAASTKSSWIGNYPVSVEEMYQTISETNDTIIYPTKHAATVGETEYYFFHAGHRIIDYRNVDKELGAIIFTFNYKLLDGICNEIKNSQENDIDSINFLLNENGEVMSFPVEEFLGKVVGKAGEMEEQRKRSYAEFINETNLFRDKNILINYITDEASNWKIVNVANQESLNQEIETQRKWILLLIVGLIFVLGIISWILMKQLTSSIRNVVSAIKKVSQGNLEERVYIDKKMPEEIRNISENFNEMLKKLNLSIEHERIAVEKQRSAEVAFLEAQINPHFIYNTLDTINWMAIDEEQYEISEAVNSLAKILRYGIDKSNETVTLKDEIDWLKQYIALQQYRLKSELKIKIDIEPYLLNYQIHKLLLQPFVENAIKHGFQSMAEKFELGLFIYEEADYIIIRIEDNGMGMPEGKVKELLDNTQDNRHIGVRNAMERMEIYYGEKAEIKIKSKVGAGTTVIMKLPALPQGEEK